MTQLDILIDYLMGYWEGGPRADQRRIDFVGDCWVWTGANSTAPNGAQHPKGKLPTANTTVHVRSEVLRVKHGWPDLEGIDVIYSTCGNAMCVNPNHIAVGERITTVKEGG